MLREGRGEKARSVGLQCDAARYSANETKRSRDWGIFAPSHPEIAFRGARRMTLFFLFFFFYGREMREEEQEHFSDQTAKGSAASGRTAEKQQHRGPYG